MTQEEIFAELDRKADRPVWMLRDFLCCMFGIPGRRAEEILGDWLAARTA